MFLRFLKNSAVTKATAAVLASGLLFPLAAQAEKTIVFNIITPPNHFTWDVFREWKAQIEDKSKGRLKIQFTAKSVAPPPKVMQAVRTGAADAGFTANIFLPPSNPGPQVGLMPWIHLGDSEATSVALVKTYGQYFEGKEKWPGLEVLSMYHFAGASMCSMTDEQITSGDNLRTRKVLSIPGNLAKMLGNMDVAVVTGPAVQFHEQVSRRTVEAFTGITYDSVVKFKIAPYTKSCIEFERAPFSINFTHFINKKTWDSLPRRDQRVLKELSGEHLARMIGRRVNEQLKKGRVELGKTAEYLPASDRLVAEMARSSQPIVDAWVKKVGGMGVDGKAALDHMRAETKRLSKVN